MVTFEGLEGVELEAACAKAREALETIGAGDAVVISRAIWESTLRELARARSKAEALERFLRSATDVLSANP